VLLDNYLPVYDVNEVHSIGVEATPERIVRAIRDLTASEIPFVRPLFAVRALPARLARLARLARRTSRTGRESAPTGSQSLWQQMLDGGFLLLDEAPGRELVVGTIGQFWKLTGGSSPRVATAREFLAFDQPDYARAAMNFSLSERPGGAMTLRTETRIHIPDAAARKRFAAYWRVIRPGSALIRRSWLVAIKRRAEQG